jgi:hypothetical protein
VTSAFVLGAAAWSTWVAGPLSMALQLAVCIALGAVAARRSHSRLLVWLFVGCAAAVLPVAGMLGMAAAAALARPRRAPA